MYHVTFTLIALAFSIDRRNRRSRKRAEISEDLKFISTGLTRSTRIEDSASHRVLKYIQSNYQQAERQPADVKFFTNFFFFFFPSLLRGRWLLRWPRALLECSKG